MKKQFKKMFRESIPKKDKFNIKIETPTSQDTWNGHHKEEYYRSELSDAIMKYICHVTLNETLPKNITPNQEITKITCWNNLIQRSHAHPNHKSHSKQQ